MNATPARTVLCMKWGTKYGPEYVNRLYGMVRRHLHSDLHDRVRHLDGGQAQSNGLLLRGNPERGERERERAQQLPCVFHRNPPPR